MDGEDKWGSAHFCDSCIDAAYDEAATDDRETLELLCADLGADMTDHVCDDQEHCLCACARSRRKLAKRKERGA